jgi:hypothetical protein
MAHIYICAPYIHASPKNKFYWKRNFSRVIDIVNVNKIKFIETLHTCANNRPSGNNVGQSFTGNTAENVPWNNPYVAAESVTRRMYYWRDLASGENPRWL